jgi:hypothetical protein
MSAPGRPIHAGPKSFDQEKLAAMIEPLAVRVVRMKNHQRMPIPLPDSNSGEPNGNGWTKQEIGELETLLVNHWSGGGLYEISVTDSSENPITMKWQPFWPPQEYPERVPPPLEGARSPDAPPSVPFNPFTGARMPFVPPTAPQPQYHQPIYGNPYPMPPPPPVGTANYGAWTAEAEKREKDAELRRLRDEADRREREAREEKHRAELERERAANNDRFSKLEQTLLGMMSAVKEAAATPKGPSPEALGMQAQIIELKEAARKAEERAEAARRDQEADRRENQLREQMRVSTEEARRAYETTQKQIGDMQRDFQTMIANLTTQLTTSSNKSDPLIQLMMENARQNADVMKEIARENRTAMERVQANVMNPRELLALARESQQGVEAAVERTTRLTASVLDMQNRVLETAINTQPQGNGVVDVVRDGMNNAKEFLERFVTSKSREAVAASQAQAEVARAQAHAVEVHARASNPQAFAPPPGLAGPAEPFTPPPPPSDQAATSQPARVERLWGRTDEEWFGPALEEVMGLRAGVTQFLLAVDQYERTGHAPADVKDIPGAHPADVARGVTMAVTVVQQRGLIVPAMVELLMGGHVPEFVTVLLPNASPKYRDDVVRELSGGAADANDVGSVDDGDDGDESEDEGAGAQLQPPASNGAPLIQANGHKPGRRRRGA